MANSQWISNWTTTAIRCTLTRFQGSDTIRESFGLASSGTRRTCKHPAHIYDPGEINRVSFWGSREAPAAADHILCRRLPLRYSARCTGQGT